MKYKELVAHFDGLTKAAQTLGLKRQNVHNWKKRRRIPSRWQLEAEKKTGGKLQADARAKRDALEMAQYVFRGQ